MKRLLLKRQTVLPDRILGTLTLFNRELPVLTLATLELPYRNNESNISCIPAGEYTVVPRYSKRFGNHLWIQDVLDRGLILFHNGNFPNETQGCVLVGMRHTDIDGDGKLDSASSKDALKLLVQCVTEPTKLTVVNV